jgi:hypothetical protein
MRRTLRSLVALTAAGLMMAAVPGAAAAHNPPTPTARTVASFGYGGFPYGQFGGSMLLGRDGRFIVAVTGIGDGSDAHPMNVGQVWTVDSHGRRATFGPPIAAGFYGVLTGLAQDSRGRIYVALANADMADEYTPPGTPTFAPGIFRVDAHSATRVATLPALHFPDKLVFADGYLYVSDSTDAKAGAQGSVWRFRPDSHNVELTTPWLVDPVLDPTADSMLGVTGLAVRGDRMWGANRATGTVFTLHLGANGKPGPVRTVLTDPALVSADSLAFDSAGALWITVNTPAASLEAGKACYSTADVPLQEPALAYPDDQFCGAVFRVTPGGTLTEVARDPGWLDYPTAVVPVREPGRAPVVYVLNGSYLFGQPAIVAMKSAW